MGRISLATTVGTAGLVRSALRIQGWPILSLFSPPEWMWPLEGFRRGIYVSRHLMFIGAGTWIIFVPEYREDVCGNTPRDVYGQTYRQPFLCLLIPPVCPKRWDRQQYRIAAVQSTPCSVRRQGLFCFVFEGKAFSAHAYGRSKVVWSRPTRYGSA